MAGFSLLGSCWYVEGTSKEENKIKSISVQKNGEFSSSWIGLENGLSPSIFASAKLSNCSSDRTILLLSVMFKTALIANEFQIKL